MAYTDKPGFTVNGLIKHTQSFFLDPELSSRAQSKLGYMRQGERGLQEFVAEFERTLLKAEANLRDDAAKILYLKRAISEDIASS